MTVAPLNRQGGRIHHDRAIARSTSKRTVPSPKDRKRAASALHQEERAERLQLGVRALGTLHIDPTLSLLIIQLPLSATGCKGQREGTLGGGGGAVISCHVTVTAERLWQL